MRILLITCLLIESICCVPLNKVLDPTLVQQLPYHSKMYMGPWSQLPQATQDVIYGAGGSNTGTGFANRQNQHQFSDGSASGSANTYGGHGSYTWAAEPQEENSHSGPAGIYGPENLEQVFSDVSDLEPVYSFSSRSSYQRGRAVFAQSRYTPGEPSYPVMPIVVRTGNTLPIRNDPNPAVKRPFYG